MSFVPVLVSANKGYNSRDTALVVHKVTLSRVHFASLFGIVFGRFHVSLVINTFLTITGNMHVFVRCRGPKLTIIVTYSLVKAIVVTGLIKYVLPLLTGGMGLSPTVVTSPLVAALISAFSVLVCFGVTAMLFHLW